MRWQALPLVVALCWSCKKDIPVPPPAAHPALTAAQLDTIRRDSIYAVEAARRQTADSVESTRVASDSLNATETAIAVLDSQVARHPSDPATANRLFLRGKLKQRLVMWLASSGHGPSDPYATADSDDYFWDEPGGQWMYSGGDWQQLVDRFPTSPVADTAGWILAHMARGGECELDFWCYYDGGTRHLLAFLQKFPGSSFVPRAEKEIVANLAYVLDSLPQEMKRAEDNGSVSATADSMIGKFEASTSSLAPIVRNVLTPVTDSLRKHFGLKPAAR